MAVFEDIFSEAQTEMIALALGCIDGNVSDVFILFTINGNMCGASVFYVKDAQVVTLQDLQAPGWSYENKRVMVSQIIDHVHRISVACEEFGRAVPTEGNLRYRVNSNSLDARYSYEAITDDDEDPVRSQKLLAWQREIQMELDSLQG